MATALFKTTTFFTKPKDIAAAPQPTITIDRATVVNSPHHQHQLNEHQYHLSLILNMNFSYPQRFDATIVFDNPAVEEFYVNEVTTSDRISFTGYKDKDDIVHITDMKKIWGW